MYLPIVCPSTACSVSFCDPGLGFCTFRNVSCIAELPNALFIGAGLATAAIVGIVIGAVLCIGGLAGGGAYAVASATSAGASAGTQNNPIYVPSGAHGQNPLYKVTS